MKSAELCGGGRLRPPVQRARKSAATRFLALIAALFPPTLVAQSAEEPIQVRQTIVVTAERIDQPREEATAAITVFTHDELVRLPVQNLGDALRFIPGLQIVSVFPGSSPMISSRGFFGAGEVEYMQLLVDGIPVGNVESGLADWRAISIEQIERIEVVRGPGSSLYGDTALGGVIQVFRRRGGSVRIAAGSFETHDAEVSASGNVASGALHYVVSEGFRKHGASEEGSATASFRLGRRFEVTMDAMSRQREDPGPRSEGELRSDRFGSNPLFQFAEEETNSGRIALQYKTRTVNAAVHASVRESDGVRTLLLAPGIADHAARVLETQRIGLDVRAESRSSIADLPLRFAAGAEGAGETFDVRYAPLAGGEGERLRGSVFVSGELRLSERLRLSSGVRWDRIEDDFENERVSEEAISPRIGINWRLSRMIDAPAVHVQLSHAFKAPTLEQRFDPRPFPDFTGGSFTISNPALKAQRAWNWEAGILQERADRKWELVGYWMTVEDEIDFDVATFRYANIGRSNHRGLEAAGEWHFGLLVPRLTYVWTRVEPTSGDQRGRQLKNIAEHLLRGEIAVGGERRSLHLAVERTTGRFLDDANQFPLEDATTIDLRARTTIGPTLLSIDILNLSDEQFAPLGFLLSDLEGSPAPFYYPAPGRAVQLTLSFSKSHR